MADNYQVDATPTASTLLPRDLKNARRSLGRCVSEVVDHCDTTTPRTPKQARILDTRDVGTAVLVASDDLDELIELAERLLVIADGRIVFEVSVLEADRTVVGHCMADHHSDAA